MGLRLDYSGMVLAVRSAFVLRCFIVWHSFVLRATGHEVSEH